MDTRAASGDPTPAMPEEWVEHGHRGAMSSRARRWPVVSRRATSWLAWGGWTLFVLLLVAGLAVDATTTGAGDRADSLAGDLSVIIGFGAFATVGALVASRQPRNAVGWCFLGCPLFAVLGAASDEYGYRAFVVDPGSLPLGTTVAWFYTWAWFPAIGLIGLVVLLFPDGRLPGRRWRYVLRLLVGLTIMLSVGMAVSPGPLGEDPAWPDNPLGIAGLKPALDVLLMIVGWSFALVVVASAASVVFRFRRSRGDEREQLKWMAFSVIAAVAMVVPTAFLAESSGLGGVAFGLGIALIPVSAGIAMLKYRLYDVDLVISKTLVYGLLTAVLAAAYVGLVLGGQRLFSSLAGGSNLAIAGSTLVVAAMFLPVRSRVQAFVDRRFYRRRYDAQRTLEGFGARLREQIDLATLERDLQGVVTETMEPAQVSLWLRGRR